MQNLAIAAIGIVAWFAVIAPMAATVTDGAARIAAALN